MSDGINATPAARELAKSNGIDLAGVTPSGATGIVVSDVEAAIEAREGAARPMTLSAGDSYTFEAPGHLGGVTVTVRKGEAVGARLFGHIPEADRELFEPYEEAAD